MTNQNPDRTRIFSHITRSRFLHLEDALAPAAPGKPGKIRFFIGSYTKGKGSQATAYHFLDLDDARPLMADLSWSKPTDFVDYKGSANGQQPISRVLKVRGPKDGKYWLEIQNGPGEIIGAGAVKPKGEPEASISIALTIWEARKMALAVLEYMAAWRVGALFGPPSIMYPGAAAVEAHAPKVTGSMQSNKSPKAPCNPPPMPKVEGETATDDTEALFGPEPAAARQDPPAPQPKAAVPVIASEAKQSPAEDKPTTFYALAPQAIKDHGLLDLVQELVKAPGSWSQKAARLQQAMAA